MAWIDTAQPVCSFVLSAAGKPDVCLDLFPSRIAFPGDPDDLLGALLAMCLDPVAHDGWNRHMIDHPLRGFSHPCGQVHQGGVVLHGGSPLPAHGVWRLAGGKVWAPDGQVFDAAAFGRGPVYDIAASQGTPRRPHDVSLPTLSSSMHVAVGALKALDGTPVLHPIEHVHYMMDALLCVWNASRRRPFGVGALKDHGEIMRGAAYDACNTWTLRCDRPYAPSVYKVLVDHLAYVTDPTCQAHRNAGLAAARIVLDLGLHAYDVWAGWHKGDAAHLSAHQRLALDAAKAKAVAVFRPLADLK